MKPSTWSCPPPLLIPDGAHFSFSLNSYASLSTPTHFNLVNFQKCKYWQFILSFYSSCTHCYNIKKTCQNTDGFYRILMWTLYWLRMFKIRHSQWFWVCMKLKQQSHGLGLVVCNTTRFGIDPIQCKHGPVWSTFWCVLIIKVNASSYCKMWTKF